MTFHDRSEAGRLLARALAHHAGEDGVVYPLPRGGVVLGVEIARALGWPIDLVIPRKVGHPLNPEYAVAAVTEHGEPVGNPRELARLDPQWLEQAIARARAEARRRREAYLGQRAPLPLAGRMAVVVDDGAATGLTLLAALRELRTRRPKWLVAAVPVASPEAVELLAQEADELIILEAPEHFRGAVGAHYQDFGQVSDAEVVALLGAVAGGSTVESS